MWLYELQNLNETLYFYSVVSNWVSCSHSRAYMYYIEAISNTDCTFWGKVEGIVGTAVG